MERLYSALSALTSRIGADARDSDEVRLRKRMLLATSFMVVPAAVLWGAIYLAFDEPAAATIPWGYAGLSAASIAVFGLTKRLGTFRSSQLFLILLLPFALMWALGGFINGSAVILWSLLAPPGGTPVRGSKGRGTLAGGVFHPPQRQRLHGAPHDRRQQPASLGRDSLLRTQRHRCLSDRIRVVPVLLEHTRAGAGQVPAAVAECPPRQSREHSARGRPTIAEYHEEASVLFADIVGSTELAVRLSPEGLVELLNEVFSQFDTLVERYGLEKIRTIGDNYMVASGVPQARSDHAEALARLALDMNSYIVADHDTGSTPLQFRIGIGSGPLVAGVIGQTKFHYDIWGDTVNTASRMESHGVPGKIQITQATYLLIKGQFVCAPRGPIEVKGKGKMDTWFLERAV